MAADARALQRFVREAKTAAQLSHPNIVGVHGMGVEENTPHYAMEYVDGHTLAEILSKLRGAGGETKTPFGKRSEQQYYLNLAKAFAEVADGLQHAHSRGVTHRDIKPSNLILDRDERLRVLDFGLARFEDDDTLTTSGDVVGTPLYMSPEQARRRKISVDHRTDSTRWGPLSDDLDEMSVNELAKATVRETILVRNQVAMTPGPAYPRGMRTMRNRKTQQL